MPRTLTTLPLSRRSVPPVFLPPFFFNATATTEIYTLSLHDALPISAARGQHEPPHLVGPPAEVRRLRSEEHTSELQSRFDLVCRLLLEKKKKKNTTEKQYNKKIHKRNAEIKDIAQR